MTFSLDLKWLSSPYQEGFLMDHISVIIQHLAKFIIQSPNFGNHERVSKVLPLP